MDVIISPVQHAELTDAADIIQKVFGKYKDIAFQEFSRKFSNESHPTYAFVAKKNGVIVGVAACLELYFSFDVYGLCWVAVLEEHRRQGICKNLITEIEIFIARDLLKGQKGSVLLSADKIELYEKLGYQKLDKSLHDGSFLMRKLLNA